MNVFISIWRTQYQDWVPSMSSEPRESHMNLQRTQTIVQALYKQILRACYWKQYPHNSWNTEIQADTYLELSPLPTSVQVLDGTLHATIEEKETPLQLQNLPCTTLSCLREMLVQ